MSEAASAANTASTTPMVIGRYALFDELAAGGMATVHLGRLLGPVGFGRTVAVKRLHSHYLKDEEFITMFMDEARIVARIRHPNVVPMIDVVQSDKGLFLVMEYVHGESLSRLMRTSRQAKEQIPPRIVTAILYGVLLGLHAAHETKGPDGKLLGVVHRDVSPQNVIVGSDGVPRVLDFGIAKAAGRAQVTREGQIKGKLAYMAPEQIRGQVDRRTDVFAASVVLWEALAGRRLHEGAKDVEIVTRVVQGKFPKVSQFVEGIPPELDAIVLRGLATDPKVRYATAKDLAIDLEKRVGLATPSEVTEWVEKNAADVLRARGALVEAMEAAAADLIPEENLPPPSLALAAAPPKPAHPLQTHTIPIEFEVPTSNEASSSNSVFAHTPNPSPKHGASAQANLLPWILVMGTCAVLAIVGVTLGTYAIVHRSPATAPSGSAAPPPTTPNAVTPPVVDPPPGTTTPPPESTTPPLATAPTAAAPALSASAKPEGSAGATATPAGTAAATPAVTTRPATAPNPQVWTPPPRPAAPKKNCDPPFTVDEAGHRKYKPECLGD